MGYDAWKSREPDHQPDACRGCGRPTFIDPCEDCATTELVTVCGVCSEELRRVEIAWAGQEEVVSHGLCLEHANALEEG